MLLYNLKTYIIMKKLMLLLLIASTFFSFSPKEKEEAVQQMLVAGYVSEYVSPQNGLGDHLPGVSIRVDRTLSDGTRITFGVFTNFNGFYSVILEPGDKLTYSYIGFKTQQITYTGQFSLLPRVYLKEDSWFTY
jgi:hypothetical protein